MVSFYVDAAMLFDIDIILHNAIPLQKGIKRMKKTIFAAVMLLTLLFSGCGETKITLDEGKKDRANHESTWSILIYACGDNGGKTSQMIKSLTEKRYPENINVVVQTGGSHEWELDGINGDYAQRFVMQKGSAYLKDQKQGTSMGSYETFSSFINWGMETFPADKYMLFVLGDGNGVEVCRDELFGGDTLSIEEIYYALSMAPNMIDALCFDAPHMASLEMASALPNYAKYMLASEEKFNGFDYGAMLDCITEYPMAQVQEVCMELCEEYAQDCEAAGTGALASISLLDLSQISHLNLTFDALALKMHSFTHNVQDAGTIVRLLESAQRCAGSDMVDLGTLASALSSTFVESSQEVLNAINDVVICNTKGSMRSASSGISVCYPKGETISISYLESTISDYYKQFLKNIMPMFTQVDDFITEGAEKSGAYIEYQDYDFALDSSRSDKTYSATINGDIALLKNVVAKRYLLDGSRYLSCGEIAELDCFWDEKRYETYLGSKVPVLKGVILDTRLASRSGDWSIYTSDILLDEKSAQIYIAYSVTEDEYTYLGVWSDKGFVRVGNGEKITLLSTDKSSSQTVEVKTLDFSGELPIKTQLLPKGNYFIEFEAEDIYRKTYLSEGIGFIS